MKVIYILGMIAGAILLLATENESAMINIIGLGMFTCSAYKLGLFEGEENKPIKE